MTGEDAGSARAAPGFASSRWGRLLLGPWAVAVVLIVHYALAVSAASRQGACFDEVAHVTAGITYWTRGEHGFNPENGNLPQRWAAIPLLIAGREPPPVDAAYRGSDVWTSGRRFLHEEGDGGRRALGLVRAFMAILGVGTCLLVHRWSLALWGRGGAMLSLVLVAFDPAMLAHGPLATSDMTACLAFLLFGAAIWRLLRDVRTRTVLMAGGAAGALALAKFSCVLGPPLALLLAGARLLSRQDVTVSLGRRRWLARSPAGRAAAMLAGLLLAAAIGAGIVWAAYGFRYEAFAPGGDGQVAFYPTSLDEMLAQPSTAGAVVSVVRDRRLLPEAFLFGLAHVIRESQARRGFLLGEIRTEGWWWFFPFAVLVKTPVAILMAWAAAALAGLAAVARAPSPGSAPRWRAVLRDTAPLTGLLAITWATALSSSFNIGHRHVLLTQPILGILAGGLAIAAAPRLARAAGAVASALLVVTALVAWPHYLAFFNMPSGGRDRAHRLLVDSSLDWGQGLPALGRWLRENAAGEPVYLSYFGNGDPSAEGIDAVRLHSFPQQDGRVPTMPLPRLSGGVYCVSATMLRLLSVPMAAPERRATLLALVTSLQEDLAQAAGDPAATAAVRARHSEQAWRELAETAERLVLDRLCERLRDREPDAVIGGSIVVHRLSDAEVAAAVGSAFSTARTESSAPEHPGASHDSPSNRE